MNKNKANQIINQLIENMNHAKTEKTRTYIDSWVIGGLKMIQSKMNGGNDYYPYNATYSMLYDDLKSHFLCSHINPKIEEETRDQIITDGNIELILQLEHIIVYNR